MDVIAVPLIQVLLAIINLFIWAIILSAVMSWLVAFNVINTSNRFVYTVGDVLHRITEPALRPFRRFIPAVGGMDLSPIALIFFLFFIESVLKQLLFKM